MTGTKDSLERKRKKKKKAVILTVHDLKSGQDIDGVLFDLAANAILFDGRFGDPGPLPLVHLLADTLQQLLPCTLEVPDVLDSVDEDDQVDV